MPGPPEEYANYIKTSWMKKLSESMPGLKRGPVGDLQCDFTQLAWSYLKYLKMPSESKAKQKSPFYY